MGYFCTSVDIFGTFQTLKVHINPLSPLHMLPNLYLRLGLIEIPAWQTGGMSRLCEVTVDHMKNYTYRQVTCPSSCSV